MGKSSAFEILALVLFRKTASQTKRNWDFFLGGSFQNHWERGENAGLKYPLVAPMACSSASPQISWLIKFFHIHYFIQSMGAHHSIHSYKISKTEVQQMKSPVSSEPSSEARASPIAFPTSFAGLLRKPSRSLLFYWFALNAFSHFSINQELGEKGWWGSGGWGDRVAGIQQGHDPKRSCDLNWVEIGFLLSL